MARTKTIVLRTAQDKLTFDADTARLISFRSKAADREFIASAPDHPAFVIQYLDEKRQYRQISSGQAADVRVRHTAGRGRATLRATYRRLAGMDLEVTTTVVAARRDRLSRWRISLRNRAGLDIVDVQFPFIVAAYDLNGRPGRSALLWPLYSGMLIRDPKPERLAPDWPGAWQFVPDNGDCGHYPGGQFAQFLAYCNGRAGLYVACEDVEGNVKLIKALHRDPGIRLGIAHVGDWPRDGERTLEYDVVMGSFAGDWYAAAEMYRSWALQQKWAVPLHRRRDVPEWLPDAGPYITLRMQGVLDAGPVFPVKEFLPYEKTVPMLDDLARRVGAPPVVVLMSWERGGPWVYPDCFPPVGGDESVTRFASLARERGWHVGSFCNGTRWVVGHAWNRYDGEENYEEHGGERSVCRMADGEPWHESWDRSWRPSYACCLGTELTRRLAVAFVRRLIGWGLESVQFFDQNINASTFACFASGHEHPPMPGKWMPEKMAQVIGEFREAARAAGEDGVIQSVEQPCNEFCLPLFQQCDVRVNPPGHTAGWSDFVPLYHFLYHECIIMQGGMGFGPEPYHLPIRNACNCVLGEIPGAVMIGDGTLLNKDTGNWAPWEPKVGDNEHALEVLRTTCALRRGPGKDFLVFGRMLAPSDVRGIETISWENGGRTHRIPAIFHAAWQAPDGRFGLVLANWTNRWRRVTVADKRLGRRAILHVSGRRLACRARTAASRRLALTVPALGCVLVES